MTDIPVACGLSDPERTLRQEELQKRIISAADEIVQLDGGLALRFAAEDEIMNNLVQVMAMERECCPFLRIQLVAEPNHGPLWLKFTGPAGTKEFLTAAFNICAEESAS